MVVMSTAVVAPRRASAAGHRLGAGNGSALFGQELSTARIRGVDVQEPAEIATDTDAFERFYRQHVEAVQRFVARRVDDPYRAADLTADVFVAAIESAGSYRRSRGEPVAWLY